MQRFFETKRFLFKQKLNPSTKLNTFVIIFTGFYNTFCCISMRHVPFMPPQQIVAYVPGNVSTPSTTFYTKSRPPMLSAPSLATQLAGSWMAASISLFGLSKDMVLQIKQMPNIINLEKFYLHQTVQIVAAYKIILLYI